MLSANYRRLAISALAATILSSVAAVAQPLAMNEPGFAPLPFPFLPPPPFFQPLGSDQQLYPPQAIPEPDYPSQQGYASPQAYPSRAMPERSYGPPSYSSRAIPEDSATEQPSAVADERFRRQVVSYSGGEAPGTIIIDTPNTYLYYVLGGGRAMRYGIGVGREGFTWAGTQTVARKQEWPDWHPPAAMIARQPYLPRMMTGGPGNPLGARAMYLGNTEYRIHGTNAPDTIGKHVSSGCIRLTNEDVEDLYNRVSIGSKVVVLPMNGRHPDVVQMQRPAPARQRVSVNTASDAPRPVASVPNLRPAFANNASASRLY